MSRSHALTAAVPWSVPMLVAGAFAVVEAVAQYAPAMALAAVPWVMSVATFVAAWGAYIVARRRGRAEAAMLASTATMLVPAAFACYLITEAAYGRYAFAGAATLLLSFYLAYLRGVVRNDKRFTPEDFTHLSFSVHVVTAFFTWYAAASLPDFIQFPMPASVVIVALMAMISSAETVRRAGMRNERAFRVGIAFAILAAESFAALAFLPTSDVVNAAVGTVLYVTGLQAASRFLVPRSAPSPTPFHRQVAFSCLLVAVVLTTARWV